MARPPKGPVGNSPRDLRDDAVGVPAEKLEDGPPMRWPPNPKYIKRDTFHAKVGGGGSRHRADRAGHFRKGGWVKGGTTHSEAEAGARKQAESNLSALGQMSSQGSRYHKNKGAYARGGRIGDLPYGSGVAKGYIHSTTAKEGVHREHTRSEGEFDGTNKRGGHVKKHVDGGYVKGGKLSMAQRKALPAKSFALPGKGAGPSGKGAGSYPINDPSHARNALARVSQHGSPAEKAAVRAKVHAKFPGIGQKEK
jgi:hypothetical protein